ncbi:MAG: hypothetical protein H0X34_20310 [Chthoniobacterales bacterium]|jgi:hypothetical protein|nr:hypothetical protein [Chthoniobacterales bacterium]
MKRLLLIPLVLLSACASHPSKRVTVARAVPVGRPVSSTGLRIPDQLTEYRIDRYVDARDPLVMHEGHPIYRVDNSARWDLRPPKGAAPAKRDMIVRPLPAPNDAVVAEVNKQRAATREFTEQTAALNQHLTELSKAVGQTKGIAKENVALKRDVVALRERLDALDTRPQDRKSSSSPQPSQSEDKW